MHGTRRNRVAALGQVSRAILEEAHARACERTVWVLNEKHLLEAVEMHLWNHVIAAPPEDLSGWISEIADRLRSGG